MENNKKTNLNYYNEFKDKIYSGIDNFNHVLSISFDKNAFSRMGITKVKIIIKDTKLKLEKELKGTIALTTHETETPSFAITVNNNCRFVKNVDSFIEEMMLNEDVFVGFIKYGKIHIQTYM